MIEVKNVHKELGEFSLRGVDLRVESGEYFVILGPTGAGKTVLLECIAGLHNVDRGEVWLEGRNVTKLAPELRHIGYVPQDYVLFPHLSLRRNIGFSLALQRVPLEQIEARTEQLSRLLNIFHLLDRKPRTLSGGEQQRGALARALAPKPALLLLDEPLSALDEGTRAELSVELSRISDELGTTVIHVCHNFDEALQLADRIAIMHQGRALQIGPPAEIFRKPDSAFIARFVGAENVFPVRKVDRGARQVLAGEGLLLSVDNLPDADELLVMIRPEEIEVTRHGRANAAGITAMVDEKGICPHFTLSMVEDRGRIMRLHLRGPLPLLATMTPQAYRAAALSTGDTVSACWHSSAVHVLKA